MLKFIRCCYLCAYYTISTQNKDKKPNKFDGFIYLAALNIVPIAVIFIFISKNDLFYFNEIYAKYQIPLFDVPRGTVSTGAIFFLSISAIFTYLVCCFKVPFDSIPERLREYDFFNEQTTRTVWTAIALYVVISFAFMWLVAMW
jgi:hypothetical protein